MDIEIRHTEVQEAIAEYILEHYGIVVKPGDVSIHKDAIDEFVTGYVKLKKK